jgi:uncharacterized Fe-S cluster-containing MiaB family protein
MTEEALHNLLRAARRYNAIHGITGVLLFHRGSFLQVLEGTEPEIERLFRSIQRDPRHRQMRVLSRCDIIRREFETWTMNFIDTGHWDLSRGMIGYNTIPEFAAAETEAKKYLRLFHLGLCRAGLVGKQEPALKIV